MTVATTTSRVEYSGNAVTLAFSVPFYFLANADLKVYVAGVLQTLTTHYSISGAGNPAGGTVTFVSAPASGAAVVIFRDPAALQETDYAPNDPFPAESHERALDKLTMIAQRLGDRADRSAAFADGYAGSADPTLPAPGAGEFLRWNVAGTALETVSAAPDAGTFTQSGAGAVARSWTAKVGEIVSVKDFGAVGDGVTSDVAAFNSALAVGGTVRVPKGTYRLNEKVTMSANGTTLWLDAGVTLLLSGVAAVQSPFGNQIHVIANDCAVIGSGPSSLLQITGGSQANAIGLLHKARMTVRNLTIDGGKSGGSAFADDTFMSGVSVVATVAGGATSNANVVIDNCEIRNFLQYGVNIYGEKANGIKVVNCNIHDIGKAGDALSVGSGIVVTRGVNDFTAANNSIISNKFHGIFCSSAGLSGIHYNINNNLCNQNTGSGIAFLEQLNYFSVAGQGLSRLAITGNNCNGNTLHGIAISCVDNVGFFSNITLTGNICNNNSSYGILSLSNASPNNVSNIVLFGNVAANNTTGNISISANATGVQGAVASFTPAVRGTSTAGTGTYGSQLGTYVRNGQMVSFQIVLDWSAHTGTGNIEITGLPVAALSSEPASACWVWANGLSVTGQAQVSTQGGSTVMSLGAVNNGTYSAVAMDTAATLRITGSYFVAS